MPGAGDTTVDNLPLAERPVLVLTQVMDSREFAVVLEKGNVLPLNDEHFGAIIRDVGYLAGVNEGRWRLKVGC